MKELVSVYNRKKVIVVRTLQEEMNNSKGQILEDLIIFEQDEKTSEVHFEKGEAPTNVSEDRKETTGSYVELGLVTTKEAEVSTCIGRTNRALFSAICPDDMSGENSICVQKQNKIMSENENDFDREVGAVTSAGEVIEDSNVNTEVESVGRKDDIATDETRKCEPCFFDEITEEAVSFCVVCAEYMCKSCTRDHRRNRVTRSHKVLNSDDLPDDSETFKQMKEVISCNDHPDSFISYKCEDHNTFICSDCMAVAHRKCEHVVEISKMSSAVDDGREAVHQLLSKIQDLITSARENKEKNMLQLKEDAASIDRERQDCLDAIRNQLDDSNEKLKDETNQLLNQELDSLAKDVKKCEDVAKEEKQQRQLFDTVANFGSIQEQIVLYEQLAARAETLLKECLTLNTKHHVSLQFRKKETKASLPYFGSVSVVKGEKETASKLQTSLENSSDVPEDNDAGLVKIQQDIETEKLAEKDPFMQSSVKRTKTMYDIKKDLSKSPCSVSAVVLLSGNRMVLLDKTKKQIKLLDEDFNIVSVYSDEHDPIDMCETNPDDLAVIFDGVKEVKRYTATNNRILFDKSFPTKLFPISISGCKDGVVILFSDEMKDTDKNSNRDTIAVQIRSLENGQIFCAVSDYTSSLSRKLVLKNPTRIFTISTQPEGYIISEEDKIHLFEIQDGKMKEILFYKSYKDSILTDAIDIAYDDEDNIYVCGNTSKNVHQISRKNYRVNRVLFSLPGNPTAMCVDSKRRLIIVGCANDDFLYVTYFK